MINCASLVRVCLLTVSVLVLQMSWCTCAWTAASPKEATLYLKSLKFVGNNLISTKDLKKELSMTLPSFWPWKKLPTFKKGDLERDRVRLKAYYRQQGFFHARIRPRIQKLANDRVAVVVQIREGPWIKVTRINLQVAPTR